MGTHKEPAMGALKTSLLIGVLLFGLVIGEPEKDFEFVDEKESFQDDEDFLAASAGSGSGEVPTGVPALYRAIINVTSEEYTDGIRDAGRDIQSLVVTQKLQAAIQLYLNRLSGRIRIRIVSLDPGSLMVTFDIDTDGQQTEEEIVELIKAALASGDLNGYGVSLDGFDFRQIRDQYTCAPLVGRTPTILGDVGNNWANLMVNNAFPCHGFVTAWNYFRAISYGSAYIGVWRQINDTEFVLVEKTEVPPAAIGPVTIVLDRPIFVQKGDIIGVHHLKSADEGVIARATGADNTVSENELFQNYHIRAFDEDIQAGVPFSINSYEYSENAVTYAIQAEMSYANLPTVTTPAPILCDAATQWTCINGDCIDLRYHCDGQYDCYDGTDEENCPELRCSDEDFRCANKRQCIPEAFVCNYVSDCEDNSDEINCAKKKGRDCSPEEFRCFEGSCIDIRLMCDSRADCSDGFDEFNCRSVPCNPGEFRCEMGQCIPEQQRCDGHVDCPDTSDELDCVSGRPGTVDIVSPPDAAFPDSYELSWIRPSDGGKPITAYMVRYRLVAVTTGKTEDGRYIIERPLGAYNEVTISTDSERFRLTGLQGGQFYEAEVLAVNADDRSSPSPFIFRSGAVAGCNPNEFMCNNGECISKDYLCNNFPDCTDSSDEGAICAKDTCNEGQKACPLPDGSFKCVDPREDCGPLICPESQFRCLDGNTCVDFTDLCNGFVDCDDRSDESNCECASGEFRCADGECIPGIMQCDGRLNCEDGSDEANCTRNCPDGTFQCVNTASLECINMGFRCDQVADCSDGSDEAECGCRADQFTCADRNCVEGRMECDGIPQCEDSSDEANCGCRADQFTCADGNCVEKRMECDGIPQCEDSSDEANCGCRADQFTCVDGNCVEKRMECDGIPQCEDSSDEANCGCRADQFTCADGNCVEDNMRCDGIPQCEDRSDEDGCGCRADQYTCADGNCIELSMHCDGVPQCEDRSDEIACKPMSCPVSDFQCLTLGRLECIDKRLQCDGYNDCSDGSDEVDCEFKCQQDEFQCVSVEQCIAAEFRCNGVIDCSDRSDELGCNCTDRQFRCGDGICIDLALRCDRQIHCNDQSDELACPCRSGEFQCRNGDCISASQYCDARVDCRDSSDEENCPSTTCSEREFTCGSGECIDVRRRCDSRRDCRDSSDEENCPSTTCSTREFTCGSGECIDDRRRCDGRRDCRDSSDEENCPTTTCSDREFTCGSGECIDARRRCDDRRDCPDSSDEENCPNRRRCPEEFFQCGTGHCLGLTRQCDGLRDCPDGSDEEGCPLRCEDSELACEADNRCLPASFKCNRVNDCSDGSDERNCPLTCRSDEFQCEADRSCISAIGKCNGVKECSDGSDEMGCPTLPPISLAVSPSNLRIREGAEAYVVCIGQGLPLGATLRWSRNGKPLPAQSSDENGALRIPVAKAMDSGEYVCSLLGVPGNYQASARVEVVAFGPTEEPPSGPCSRDEAVCQNGQCIRREYRCDGEEDCADGSDEPDDCKQNLCEPNEFRCPSGQCVMKIWRCDGENDCADGFDELDCQTEKDPNAPCGSDEFQCVSRDQCIPLAYQCDKEIDCLDRSDEIGCSPPVVILPPVNEIEVEIGGSFTIICEAVGVPMPLIVWRLNWGNIPTGVRVVTTSVDGYGVLTISDARYEDAGAYTCEAINNRGSIFAIPDALVIVTQQRGPCVPPFFNLAASSLEECVRCFCFGQNVQCFSSDLQVSRLALAGQMQFVSREDDIFTLVDQSSVDFRTSTREYQVLDMTRSLPQGSYYWTLPREFLGERLTSYGGELKYTIYYEIEGRQRLTTTDPDVIISGNGITLYYRGRTLPASDISTSISVPLIETAWEKTDGPRRGDTPISQYASREDLMMVLENVTSIVIRGTYDQRQTTSRIGGIFMTTAVDYQTEYGQAVLVEQCTCPTGYTGLSCQECKAGFTRIQTGPYLGQCVTCNCNGHSNDCDPITGRCLNCQHNTYGSYCQLCADGFYGDSRRGTEGDCQACPCPLTTPSNQFSRTCFVDTDNDVTCAACPEGYEGRRCQRCANGFMGDPLTPGSTCRRVQVEDYCDPRGSLSARPNPITGLCECKENVMGALCDSCKSRSFYLSDNYNQGCVACFCMGVSRTCQSTSWNRAQVGLTFTNDRSGVSIANAMGTAVDDQRFVTNDRELVYRSIDRDSNTLYWALPRRFLGDKVTAYGGSLRFTLRYYSQSGALVDNREPLVKISGNDITLNYRTREELRPNRRSSFNVVMFEQNWVRSDGQPATREHFLMALADLDSILIRASYESEQREAGLRDVTLDIAEDRETLQDRAYTVEQCVCRVGYRGLSCEDCDTGYTRSGEGIYLGLCEACKCNGHSNDCDPDTGVCRNCQHNTAGDNCEKCAVGTYGDATRGSPNDCAKCPCPLTESPNQFSPSCMLDTDGQVTCTSCPGGHTGRRCETCMEGYTGNPSKPGDYCKLGPVNPCECDSRGTVPNTQCDSNGLQCQCKPYTQGLRCRNCREGYFYMEAENAQGCLPCYCSGITNQCTSSSYYRETLRPQFRSDGTHGFSLLNRRMNNAITDGFVVNAARGEITFTNFAEVQRERESLFFQLPAKFRGDRITSYGGYLRFTLEFNSAQSEGSMYRDVDLEIISPDQSLRVYHLFEPALQEGRPQTYEILLRENSFRDLRSNSAPTRETFMKLLSNIEGFLIRATYHQNMASVTLRDLRMDTAVPSVTDLGGAPMVESCRCPEGYTGLSCQRCAPGYLRVSEGPSELGRCVRCNCNDHSTVCDPDTGRCLECQHNTVGDRCEQCAPGFYGDATSGTPGDCKACPCPLTVGSNQFSKTCYLADDRLVTCDRCPTGYTGRNCETCASGYVGSPRQIGATCRPQEGDLRPNVTVSPVRVEEPAGSRVIFGCSVSSQSSVNVVWSRLDSVALTDRAYVSPRYDLRINDLQREDSGRYVCTATNGYGVSRGVVDLTVVSGPTPLKVYIDNTETVILEGRTARFVCTATGGTVQMPNILSWNKYDSAMPAKAIDQNGVLIIPNVQTNDAGRYVCTGSDFYSTDTATAVLIVEPGDEPAPTVRIEPRYQTIEEGKSVRFVCIASGSPPPRIEWYRGGGRPMNPNAEISADGVFTIPRISADDEADYYCKATNEAGTTEVRTILYITRVERPDITVIVRRTSVVTIVGQTARLECYVEDNTGRVTLFWSKQSGLPSGSSQEDGILTIPRVQSSYAGNYVCTGTDLTSGTISTAITRLEVQVVEDNEPPTVRVEPERLTVAMGTTGTLRCTATGSPAPTVKWMKSREELSDNHQVSGNTLRITQATMADRGLYVCRAENVAGMEQDWAIVEIERRMRPKIDLYPNTTQKIVTGGSALFQCRVMDGDPPPKVTWSRVGGAPLTSRMEVMKNGVIMFKQATQEEQGSYICTATNDMGTITATATLIVEGPPSITIQPSKVVYALVGQRVTLECTAAGEPTPNVYWVELNQPRRGDLPPDAVESAFPSYEGSAIFDIASVDRSDQGYYRCVAENSGGRTEDTVQIVVESGQRAGVKIAGPTTLSVSEGQNVELVCTADAIRNPSIRWRRREGVLPPGHGVSNGVLRIQQFRSEYAGEYICSTTAPQGSFEASVYIIVTVAPRLSVSPQRVTARAGEPIVLRCTASGSGPYTLEWSRVDAPLSQYARVSSGGQTSTLEINQVTAADAGRYRCTIVSESGTSADGYTVVSVQVPPAVVVSQRDAIVQQGRTVELRCDFTGDPAPTVRWSRQSGEMPDQIRSQGGILTIYNVQPADEGRYICTATSNAGSARDYSYLRVRSSPVIDPGTATVDTKIVNVGDRVSMECIVTGTPLPVITWTRDDGPLPADVILGDGILIIPQAKVEDAGTYTCTAVNEAGSITSKVVLVVRVSGELSAGPGPRISTPQRSASAALGGSISLACDTSGYPSPQITWYRRDGRMPQDYTIVDGDLKIDRVRPEDAGTYVCSATNQYGKTDLPVDLQVGDLVPYFAQDPSSYMAFPPLNDVYLDFDILLSLKPESTEGTVLYNGQFKDGGGDFVCFGLNEGYPEFRFDVGSGPAIIRGNQTLGLNKWHTVKLTRNRKQGTMVVDDHPAYTGESPGYFTGLDLVENMYLGSVPDYNTIPAAAGFSEGFVGTVSEVKIKGISMNLGAEALEIVGVDSYNECRYAPCMNGGTCVPANTKYGYNCLCPQGYAGARCEAIGETCYPGACGDNGRCYNLESQNGFRCVCPLGKTGAGCQVDVNIINPFFNRTSFISYPAPDDGLFSLVIYVEFKAHSLDDGIILYDGNQLEASGDFIAIVLKDGYVEFRFDTGSGPAIVRSRNPVRLNEWTRVTVKRKNREGTLIVNDDEAVTERPWGGRLQNDRSGGYFPRYYNYYQYKFKRYRRGVSPGRTVGLNLKLPLYLGGSDPTVLISANTGVSSGFVGCIAALQMNDLQIDLINDAIESSNIVDCGERRLCDRQPCANGAVCEDLPGPDYRCLCSSAVTGKLCEIEINICLTNSPCQNGAPCSITNEGYRCDCPLGYDGDNCDYRVELGTRFSMSGDGFAEFTKDMLRHTNTQERQTISFDIRTTATDGLILWQGEQGGRPLRGGDFFSIGLRDGYLELSYEMGSGPAQITSVARVNDGYTHAIVVERLGRDGKLTIDTDEPVSGNSQGFLQMLNAEGNIYIGGVSSIQTMTGGKFSANFNGCIENIVIQGKGPLVLPQDAISGFNVMPCLN